MKEELNISLIQTDLFWENPQQNREHFTGIISQIKNADLIILPETFTTGFSMKNEVAEIGTETVDWMKKMAVASGAAIAGSFFIKDGSHAYNRMHFVTPEGKITIYNKKHLFRLTNEQDVFSAGNEQVVVEYKGWKIALYVCYDLRFPVWMRRSPKNDYDLILVVANWPERRSFAWSQLLTGRAIENQTYVAAVNRIGKDGEGILYGGESVVIDPMGKTLARGSSFGNEILQVTIQMQALQSIRQTLPFYEDRDQFGFD